MDIWSPKDDPGPSTSKVSSNGVHDPPADAVESEEEEAEQDYEYSDEEVIIPTGTRLIFHKPDAVAVDGDEEEAGEQDEVYSDDELFAGSFQCPEAQIVADVGGLESAPKSLTTPPQHMSLVDIDPSRPNFKLPYDPANDVPLILDPAEPDIPVPASINRFLKAYQRDGAKFLFSKYREGMGGVLGDDMG